MEISPVIARNSRLAQAGLELAHASGVFRLAERRAAGTGAILRLEHVRPRSAAAFQPLRHKEITPRFLERMIRALQRWKFEFVSVAEARVRAQRPRGKTRFVALTFDGAYRDFLKYAYPVLQRYEVPFSLYVPTGFVDNIAQAWWLALEAVVARSPRIILFMKGEERRFRADSPEQKYQVFDVLYAWMLTLPPDELSAAITDLCNRYDVDLKTVSRDIAMDWPDILKLADDPRATIASATVSYPVLANVTGPVALREMKMGRMILETALGRVCEEFAYPFGGRETFSRRDVLLAKDAGFAGAVSARPGLVVPAGGTDALCLPRIAWQGRPGSLRALRVVLSGLTMRRERRLPAGPEEAAP
jgi:peptidoglycan/xylan/chitin deacetylase (PgdA/CDA1 family)